MDNNQNNNFSGSSYNNGNYNYSNGNQNQNTNGTWGGSGNPQNSWSANAGNNANAGNMNDTVNAPKQKRPKKEHKKGGFGEKLAKCVAIALVFGLVGGSVFAGTNYAVGRLTGSNTTQTANVSEQKEEETSHLKQSAKDTSRKDAVDTTDTSGTATSVSDVSRIVSEVMPSIVAITNMSEQQYENFFGQTGTRESESAGSGIIVSQDDNYLYIATNNHVVEGASTLTVQFIDDSTASAEVKGTAASSDLAVVQVAKSSMQQDTLNQVKVATLGDSDSLQVGEGAIAIGNALGYGQSVTTGVISAVNRSVSMQDETTGEEITNELLQTDAAINPGNSGGALLNMKGEVIGINSAKFASSSVEGMGYAIPISKAQPILEDLMSRETRDKVDSSEASYLGIQPVDLSSETMEMFDMPEGVFVSSVSEGEAAANAGIQKGDIITGFDGQIVTGSEDLENKMAYYAAGETVDVTIARVEDGEYKEQTVQVTLGSRSKAAYGD